MINKKEVFFGILILLVGVFLISFISFVSAFSGLGAGTAGDPYQITNCSQLNETRNALTASYVLTADINFSSTSPNCTMFREGAGWEPVGDSDGAASPFSFQCVFDGRNHTVSDLYIYIPVGDLTGVGLFGAVYSGE